MNEDKKRLAKTIREIREYRAHSEENPFRLAQLIATKEFLIEKLNS